MTRTQWRRIKSLAWSLRSGRKPGGPASIAETPSDQTSDSTRSAASAPWEKNEERFCMVRAAVHPQAWSESLLDSLLDTAESWLRAEGGAVAVARARQSFEGDLHAMSLRGYRGVRQAQMWQLDL